MTKRVIVIGGGASGMMAAIQAARKGADVIILEHLDRVGKKLLSTGNGRCNLTNLHQTGRCYRCSQEGFVSKVLDCFCVDDTIQFFRELGILTKERNGYIYPNSDQASSVLDVLRMELDHQNIQVLLGCQVVSVRAKDHFYVKTNQGTITGDALILAAGSRAAPGTGSDGSGYDLARAFGHRIVTPLPALVQLRCKERYYKQLAGIRTEARVEVMARERSQAEKNGNDNWRVLAQDQGELQLTDYGLSGIPVFQVSRYAAISLHKGNAVKVRIDFLPQMTWEEADAMLDERRNAMGYKTWEQWIIGLLNKKLGLVLLKLAGIDPGQTVFCSLERQHKALLKQIKGYETEVAAVNPFEQAQVCCGGVDTVEVCPMTMESKKVPELYFAGEILDVDGICGGYNLQWAWSSGTVAGRCAALGHPSFQQ